MNKKPKLVIFEGVDKVGKTTIFQAFRKRTDYAPLCIDRFIGSNFAYDSFFGRADSIENLFKLEYQLMGIFDCVLVYLTCDRNVLIKRIREHDEEALELKPIKEIGIVDELFGVYYIKSSFRKIMINTSYNNVGEVVDMIIEFMNREGQYK